MTPYCVVCKILFTNNTFFSAKLPHEIRLHEPSAGRWRWGASNGGICTTGDQRTAGVQRVAGDGALGRQDQQVVENTEMRPTGCHTLCRQKKTVHGAGPEVDVYESNLEVSN